ncbi:glycoside hydrolase family 76 protein [Thermothelomyces thermophilus ATCC 42464]|uniref:Mannan endo-1,6-alpha-mannosidase n=1 Tax=Thermothelomyces thermophilus (strain ATCC 42464 / BCRC 31852 / DSM 1799) TaxID=573729 RepID=G2Q8A7_THET4|nr:glycoside hydrolase family 76 protein [Thermothelomyces thermophilus ATCC 42464]AEO57010.1 glycoside hydrolase family 76 protein [Thermothelomyces thermophilus ATCC 42464]
MVWTRFAAAALAGAGVASAAYSIATTDGIKKTAADVAWDLLQYYHGNESGQTPGILPGPPPNGDYYWWEAGAMWGTFIDYWKLTGDSTYNDLVTQAMLFQVGPDRDYRPPNYTASLGNDDQAFWGMSAMTAAENNFPNPPADQPQWLALAQAVFNTQASPEEHDDTCNGGLRWQIYLSNNGYDYKNSIANGCFFNLGARLARYTGNKTYAEWAEKTWDWVRGVGYMDDQYNIYDGGHVQHNCTDINRAQFSYNNAVYLLGAAFMYNYTNGSDKWREAIEGLADATIKTFFPDGVAYEIACEQGMTCTADMLSFKGYLHRWLATATQVAPILSEKILPVLKTSTEAAVSTCTGEANGRTCGFQWSKRQYDGSHGAGQQMNVLAAVSSLLIDQSPPPYTNMSGGTSKGDPLAGTNSRSTLNEPRQITGGDRAGAGILTILLIAAGVGTFGWMSTGV